MSDSRPPLTGKASQDTVASLRELEPMPMPDSPLPTPPAALGNDKSTSSALDDAGSGTIHSHPPSVSASGKSTTGALGLGHGHGSIYYLSRIQRYSSYAFTIFASVHLATASLIPLATRSVPASESYLLLAREIYQTRVSEPLLVFGPIVAHVAAGIGLRLVRQSQNQRRYGGSRRGKSTWPGLSWTAASGYVFSVTLAAHLAVNRLLPIFVQGDSSDISLAYVSHGFARHPLLSWLSYGVFLGAASAHMVWGWARWLGVAQRAAWMGPDTALETKPMQRRRRRAWLMVQSGVLLAFCAWASGGLGIVARGGSAQGWVAKVYDELYDKALFS
ncbi:hypothetical protein SEPCBS119000_002232 [Sporothrix epigloea]|uniref:Mitochondrial adapter protein MCP1 transmembrane domain-containing protein n=1 Tax=Sporothrix epigloea TaxID=1892477 RepID=A0ABP0DGP4_9PEZI